MDQALAGELELQHLPLTPAIVAVDPRAVGALDPVKLVPFRHGLEPEVDQGMSVAGELRHRPLGYFHLHIIGLHNVEGVALVQQLMPFRASSKRYWLTFDVDDGDGVALSGARQYPYEVPPIFPVHGGELAEAHRGVASRGGPGFLLLGEGRWAALPRDDLQSEVVNSRHALGGRVTAELHLEALRTVSANNQDLLAKKSAEVRIGFILPNDWQSEFENLNPHLLSKSRSILEFPFIERQRP
ncbi:MAG: hypothetical protein H7A46_23500 [Verrucomicrobiales bacterium]|nr:hypothetical protein [Verrucomicrobiales bacterium]